MFIYSKGTKGKVPYRMQISILDAHAGIHFIDPFMFFYFGKNELKERRDTNVRNRDKRSRGVFQKKGPK